MQPQFAHALLGRLRIGIGTTRGGPILAIIVNATGVDLVSTPRAVEAHGAFDVVATIDPRVKAPQLTITRDDGTIEHTEAVISDEGRTLRAAFACGEHTGRQWIQIDATGLGGTLPRVVVPILCGDTWPSRFLVEPHANIAGLASPSDIERRLTSIINRQRARAGVPLLRTEQRIAASARLRSMSLHGRAGDAAASSTPAERLRAVGLVPLAVHESLLEVDSVGQATDELMNEAMYRVQLESPASTHIGVGVDDAGGHLAITITYADYAPRIDPSAVARCIGDGIETVESSLVEVPLSRVAQVFAEGLANGGSQAQLWPRIGAMLLRTIRYRYKYVTYTLARITDVLQIDPRTLIHGQILDDVGVGVAQSLRDGPQRGATWVVLFLAQRLHWRPRAARSLDTARLHACLAAAIGRSPPTERR